MVFSIRVLEKKHKTLYFSVIITVLIVWLKRDKLKAFWCLFDIFNERFPRISAHLWEPNMKWAPRALTRVNTECSLGWIKFHFTKNSFLPFIKQQKSFSSPHFVFQSVYALNTRSIKIHRRSFIKVLITLLILKNNFIQHIDWLLPYFEKCNWTKFLINIHKQKLSK